ncbi:MAG: serine/threonine protein kinase [Spartobacteria bacterium]|nr:serine/threonine protein kinase [Spartobacteria bacterium]
MKTDEKILGTTYVEVVDDAASSMELTSTMSAAHLNRLEPSNDQLRANYHAIIDAQAIYYPVAYRLVRELGRGRQGIVFMGLRQGARGCITRHAIKLFDPKIYGSASKYWTDMGRIAAQTSRLQTVRSPNLVARDTYEETNGIGFLQMEAINGVDLRYILDGAHLDLVKNRSTPFEWSRFTDAIFRLENGRMSIQPGIALYIMRQILRGLETLHETGFVHSDVKPANVMVDRLGYVKMIDYGRAVKANEPMTILFGSPLYMAPELHRREANLHSSDIYSVGLLGLEMLRGEPLLTKKGLTEKDLLEYKMKLPQVLPDLLPDHVRQNDAFVDLLRRFIEPNPKNRFKNASDAESGSEGLRLVHQQLAQLGKDTEYGRELQGYLSKLIARPDSLGIDDFQTV